MAQRSRMPAILVVAALALAGCAGAPVQEMSNARQAIRAARDAGAERAAPQKLNEAEALLIRAEDSLERRAYREARRNAISARYSRAAIQADPLVGDHRTALLRVRARARRFLSRVHSRARTATRLSRPRSQPR